MTTPLPPYPAYKDSGVPWLGQVPQHWGIRPLKRWVRVNAEALPETTPVDYCFGYLDIGAVGTGVLVAKPQTIRFGDAPSRARRVLRRGDTIVSTVRTYLKAVYHVSGAANDLIASTGFAVLTPGPEVVPAYLSFLAQSDPFTDRVCADSVGTAYPAIAETRLASFHQAMPPPAEQSAIVRYLDYMDRRIRRYIAAKRKLIALLNEQKQAIIHQAVTRGLDPNVPPKPSGIEWLGDVPEHWEVVRSKYLFREVDARSATGSEVRLSMSQKLGLVPSSQVDQLPLMSASYEGGKLCETDDLVLNRLKAHLGVFALASQAGIVSPDYTVLRAVRPLCHRYFEMLYRTPACRIELRQRAKGIVQGFWRLYTDDFYQIVVPCPPSHEQECIVERVDTELLQLQMAIDRADRGISLVREYRTRLIADVVTGKLDVQAAAAALPEEAEEGEPVEDSETAADQDEEVAGDGATEDDT